MQSTRELLFDNASSLIQRLRDGERDDAARDALLGQIAAWQRVHVSAYQRLCNQQPGTNLPPALPTDVFRFTRVAAHPPEQDVNHFISSGTTDDHRSTHHFRDFRLYDLAARTAAKRMLFPDVDSMDLVIIAPTAAEANHSSLAYMLDRFTQWFGQNTTYVWQDNHLMADNLVSALRKAQTLNRPVALLGTSFAFVHAHDALDGKAFELPTGSRCMYTGGYKGRSRVIAPSELRRLIVQRYGIDEAMMVGEYGMTELSSQMYETTLRDRTRNRPIAERRYWVPGWVRATAVDADTLQARPDGENGILRIDDIANLDSVAAIQTADIAKCYGDEFELFGRSPDAVPRGCSMSADIALGRP